MNTHSRTPHQSEQLLMMWFFTRDAHTLRVEMRYDPHGGDFTLGVCGPDGDQYERVPDVAACRSRLIELETQLGAARWVRARHGR